MRRFNRLPLVLLAVIITVAGASSAIADLVAPAPAELGDIHFTANADYAPNNKILSLAIQDTNRESSPAQIGGAAEVPESSLISLIAGLGVGGILAGGYLTRHRRMSTSLPIA
jgi:hypothetical protein